MKRVLSHHELKKKGQDLRRYNKDGTDFKELKNLFLESIFFLPFIRSFMKMFYLNRFSPPQKKTRFSFIKKLVPEKKNTNELGILRHIKKTLSFVWRWKRKLSDSIIWTILRIGSSHMLSNNT